MGQNLVVNHALCDLGASVSVIPTCVYYKLNHTALELTSMCVQLADQSVWYPLGIAINILVKIRDFSVLVDFVVLDMHPDSRMSLILWETILEQCQYTQWCWERTYQIHHQRTRRVVHIQAKTRAQLFYKDGRSRQARRITTVIHSGMISGINNLEGPVWRTLNFEPSPEGNLVFTPTYFFSLYIFTLQYYIIKFYAPYK